MKLAYAWFSILIIVLLCGITGCKKNIQDTASPPPNPNIFSFNAPYHQTWNAVVEAVTDFNTIDILDPASGFISTGLTTFVGDEISPLDNNQGDWAVRFSYNIKLSPGQNGETSVMVQVELFEKPGLGPLQGANNGPTAASVLRDHLFTLICHRLVLPEASTCQSVIIHTPLPASQFSSEITGKKLKYEKRVSTAQKMLNKNGYKAGLADGLLGATTRKAIKYFQRDNGLPVRGELDAATYDLLIETISRDRQGGKTGQLEAVKVKPAAFSKVAVQQHNPENGMAQPPSEVYEQDSQTVSTDGSAVPDAVEEGVQPPLPVEGDSATAALPATAEVIDAQKSAEKTSPTDQDTDTAQQSTIGGDTPRPVNPAAAVQAKLVENESGPIPPTQQPSVVLAEKYIVFETAYLLEDKDLYSAKILEIIPEGTTITVLTVTGDYYKIQYKGVEGFIHADFVSRQK